MNEVRLGMVRVGVGGDNGNGEDLYRVCHDLDDLGVVRKSDARHALSAVGSLFELEKIVFLRRQDEGGCRDDAQK